MKKRGSALLIVLLVITGVVTVAFGAQRIALIQYSQSSKEENNLYAYRSAMSGIEDGLLRFRYERNVSTPENKVQRIGLTNATNEVVDKNSEISDTTGYNPKNQYYDLEINYKTAGISDQAITKNDYLEMTGFPTAPLEGQSNSYLNYQFTFDSACNSTDLSNAFVQVQKITRNATTGAYYSMEQVNANRPTTGDNVYYSSSSLDKNMEIANAATSSLASSVRMTAYYCNVTSVKAFVTNGPTDSSSNGQIFDSLTTKVISTGYYGDAKTTLIAEIDRKSGTLLGIYDYTLYAGKDIKN